MAASYRFVKVRDTSYRMERTTSPVGEVAFIYLHHDRLGNPLGWRVNPLVCTRAPSRRVWPTPEEAIASMKLMSKAEARAALKQAVQA